jgi:GNAT superfamily N-acetyltransferase
LKIREGHKEDLPRVLELIRELAEFENAPEQVTLSLEMFQEDGFGPNPVYGFFVAENEMGILGMALFYYRYSTWKGKTLFLEDIIVTLDERGKGIGKALFERVISKAKEENCQRMSWQVLDWNEPAIKFYKKYDAYLDDAWVNCDLYKEQIDDFNT